jgi:hypothetical protein
LFDTLKKDGHNLVFENAYPGPQIKYYDEFFYDNIIMMAPGVKELRTPIDPKDLITFLEANHNLMVFADAESKRPIRQLANEFGVEFEGAGYEVRDYSTSDSGKNLNVVYSNNFFEPFTTTSKGIFSKS